MSEKKSVPTNPKCLCGCRVITVRRKHAGIPEATAIKVHASKRKKKDDGIPSH